MLDIKIFNVDHGFCAVVNIDDKNQILVDAGYGINSRFSPKKYLLCHSIKRLDYLIVPAFNEEGLSGFYDLLAHSLSNQFSIGRILTNPSVEVDNLPELIIRTFSVYNSLSILRQACQRFSNVERTIRLGGAELSFFWNMYPEFLDFHNLSLVTFLSYQNVCMVFPGNLKSEGWKALLRNSKFCDRLRHVNLFVASKYGQIDGYCSDVFNYCNPELVIVSNGNQDQLSTTENSQCEYYAKTFQQLSDYCRVLTTRNSGDITIQQISSDSLQVSTQRHKSYQLSCSRFIKYE